MHLKKAVVLPHNLGIGLVFVCQERVHARAMQCTKQTEQVVISTKTPPEEMSKNPLVGSASAAVRD